MKIDLKVYLFLFPTVSLKTPLVAIWKSSSSFDFKIFKLPFDLGFGLSNIAIDISRENTKFNRLFKDIFILEILAVKLIFVEGVCPIHQETVPAV